MINHPVHCELDYTNKFLPLSEVEFSARFAKLFSKSLIFEPYMAWTYSPCETTYEAIFGKNYKSFTVKN